ncbi:MAG: hypothetical protein M1820_010637 [Bogoriella megaspora]|nr:MAG: hypothetical protein M1820_010637 [Bogoriella megaspora]
MHFSTLTTLLLPLSTAALTSLVRRQQQPAFPYGIDPSKPFVLRALTTDGETSYNLGSYYTDKTSNTVGLYAAPEDLSGASNPPGSNFTLVANHYGTQLSVYQAPPTGGAAVAYGNYPPTKGQLLTFHQGINEPNFGGLAFYGQYLGGDFEAGFTDILGVGLELSLQPYTVCNKPRGQGNGKALFVEGTDKSCQRVTVYAYPATS